MCTVVEILAVTPLPSASITARARSPAEVTPIVNAVFGMPASSPQPVIVAVAIGSDVAPPGRMSNTTVAAPVPASLPPESLVSSSVPVVSSPRACLLSRSAEPWKLTGV